MFVVLGKFMVPCHLIPAIFDTVKTFSFFEDLSHVFKFKNFYITKKQLLIKQNMNQKTFGFYLFEKLNLLQI